MGTIAQNNPAKRFQKNYKKKKIFAISLSPVPTESPTELSFITVIICL